MSKRNNSNLVQDLRIDQSRMSPTHTDMINHPPHYKSKTGLESIDVIDAFELDFSLGNAVAYILRAGRKGPKGEDLKKAIWYLNHELELDLQATIANVGESHD